VVVVVVVVVVEVTVVIVVVVVVVTFMQAIQCYIPKQTTFLRYVQCCSCSVFRIFATCNVNSSMIYILYIYISTSRSLRAVLNVADFAVP
jgi:hypothetical protein